MVYKVLLCISFHFDSLHTFGVGIINIISQIKKLMVGEMNRLSKGQRSSVGRGGIQTKVLWL